MVGAQGPRWSTATRALGSLITCAATPRAEVREAGVSRILLETSSDRLLEEDRRAGVSVDVTMTGGDCFWLRSIEGRCLNRANGAPRRRVEYKWDGGTCDDWELVAASCFKDSAANAGRKKELELNCGRGFHQKNDKV
ncbi:Retrotransposon protein with reverse transcriptase domain [Klebsormidium nitens]|uniref:Retrotransposon protein with reverse transcriptase domain n=1 Tax=Klebsormidium nitens TaxID=105231 RepID=A0A1Y1ITN1_KLENI|nr:Retrotransposon protein with reverse transcriptase domain [Klebsormidium nitens]|eukprot:GAQ93442.1 Retrotransposon protein with reverse transcriptase domain [Klebsormidium nitens]